MPVIPDMVGSITWRILVLTSLGKKRGLSSKINRVKRVEGMFPAVRHQDTKSKALSSNLNTTNSNNYN
jgi:hypothetical protein